MQESEKIYPSGYSDSELIQKLNEFSSEIKLAQTPGGNVNIIPIKAPLMQLGLADLQKRSSDKTAIWSRVLAGVSLSVACVALYISYQASEAASTWEAKQLSTLKQLTLYQQQSLDVMTRGHQLTEEAKEEFKANSEMIVNELQKLNANQD